MRATSGVRLLVALGDFAGRLPDQDVEQVVGLDAEPLAAGHLDERPLRVFGVGWRRVTELPRGRVRQRHHLVGEVMRPLGAFGMPHVDQRLLQQLLEVRLPHVDHVVDVGRAAERRMIGAPPSLDVAHSDPGRVTNTR